MTPEQQAAADAAAAEQKKREETAERTRVELARQESEKAKAAKPAEKPEPVKPAHEVEPPAVGVNNPNAPEAVRAQHEMVDKRLADRNEGNLEGHEKNMRDIEAKAEEAQARTAHADDPRANHVPTGKEINNNTPTILPDGTKVWN